MKKYNFDDNLYPSSGIWDYYIRSRSEITIELILSSIADKIAGYHISYSAEELLRDLGLVTKNGKINKKGFLVLSHSLYYSYHKHSKRINIIEPKTLKGVQNESKNT